MWRPPNLIRRTTETDSKSGRPQLILSEILKKNAFRGKKELQAQNGQATIDLEALSLNKDLSILANFFPDIQYEVLREMLQRFDGESRLEVALWQLYMHKAEWVGARVQNPPRTGIQSIPLVSQFRTRHYQDAAATALRKEFPGLNSSSIAAILAEVNCSYTLARPLLQQVADKSWRALFRSLFRVKKASLTIPIPIAEVYAKEGSFVSGNEELDQEMKALFLVKPERLLEREIEHHDHELAILLNRQEAAEAQALFECQVCYNDVPFESVTACTSQNHYICRHCVVASVKEAVFGQGFTKTVDQERCTIKCVALVSNECDGYIPSNQTRDSILLETAGRELWFKFESRQMETTLMECCLDLVRCPFCNYTEIDDTQNTRSLAPSWRLRPWPVTTYLSTVSLLILLPFILLVFLVDKILPQQALRKQLRGSLLRLERNARTTRFRCLSPTCGKPSCLKCRKAWYDPHVCHEPMLLSLRAHVEAARTAAVKRVCPRCHTAFVKSSGCNKLVCPCGYAMCYLCRKDIGHAKQGDGQGYRHFCEHFRPRGGNCTQCEKCELYKDEDEEVAVRLAGERAEKEWRKKMSENGKDVRAIVSENDVLSASRSWSSAVSMAYESWPETLDKVVATFISVQSR